MAEITNYTPGEYAKEHIRITPTTLADVADAAATPPMVAAISLAPVAASATDRDISFVVHLLKGVVYRIFLQSIRMPVVKLGI